MCIVDPQAIILFSDLITDTGELKKEIEKFVPKTFVTEIAKIEDVLE